MEPERTSARRSTIPLLVGAEHPCSYLPGREARMIIAAPEAVADAATYSLLLARGFRRSGAYLYRPRCHGCDACVPARLAVAEFRPDRSQRRCLRSNADLEVATAPLGYDEEQFALYRRYLAARHPGGGMDDPRPGDYLEFLSGPWPLTLAHEFRLGSRLVAVAVSDALPDAVSAVYTFFDPDPELAARGLGTAAVLHQIEWARDHARRHLYLGYWIEGCAKMSYKDRFRPQQRLGAHGWSTSA